MKLAEPHKRACIYKHINQKLVISVCHIPLRSQIISRTEVFALLGRYAAVIGSYRSIEGGGLPPEVTSHLNKYGGWVSDLCLSDVT
jgi:hypothetical protein